MFSACQSVKNFLTAAMVQSVSNTPLVLIILDGWGERQETDNNGIELAKKPFFDRLKQQYSWTSISASEEAVGLPQGVMGNSEVGHMNIGAGRIVYSGLSQIYKAIDDGSFFSNTAFLKAIETVRKNKSTLHLMGLLSDGAVHSHQDHLFALLKMAKNEGLTDVALHCFMDGRDTAPNDGIKYLKRLQEEIKNIGMGRIASISGRFFAMDRDTRWERTELAYKAICGESKIKISDPVVYLESCYASGEGDEFMKPACVDGAPPLNAKDALIFFNFRADRARQITQAFTKINFTEFARDIQKLPETFVCATPYDSNFNLPVAFQPSYPQKVLGEILAEQGLKQLRLAETEKYAHVTFFFNGGRDQIFDGEERVLIKSPKEVATYDLKPEMSAIMVKEACLNALQSKKFDVVIMNFANADMVGHTAKPESIFKAIETIDHCLAEIIPEILKQGGTALITADHGNAEQMIDKNGEPMTAHTLFLVPFIVVSEKLKNIKLEEQGRLCDIAPTMLKILGLQKPEEMTGRALL